VTAVPVANGVDARAGLGDADALAVRYLARTYDDFGNAGGSSPPGTAALSAEISSAAAAEMASASVIPAAASEPLMAGKALRISSLNVLRSQGPYTSISLEKKSSAEMFSFDDSTGIRGKQLKCLR
jgi:Ethanolamine utilization protein EutJ (predicted chaperonin)